MQTQIGTAQFRALAELRYQIRQFVSAGDAAARDAGLEPQQYQLPLAIRGLPETTPATVSMLAERLALKHNSAVELVNRLKARGMVRRERTGNDRRSVLVRLRPAGAKLVGRVAQQRIIELRGDGAALVSALHAVLTPGVSRLNRKRASKMPGKKTAGKRR